MPLQRQGIFMGFVDDAIDAFTHRQHERVTDWAAGNNAEPFMTAAIDVVGETIDDLRSPMDKPAIAVNLEWLKAGAVATLRSERTEVYARSTTGSRPSSRDEVELYLLDECDGCGRRVPIGPALAPDRGNVAEVALFGDPVGHDCPKG